MWKKFYGVGKLHSKESGQEIRKMSDRVTPCRFWKWIDDSVPPLVRHAMDMNMKKSEKAKLLGVALIVCCNFFLVYG
ncbi:hypothetical protein Leryth_013237 [Lithospermum erythrorhizon]|nr:hypothetical protein Leryth_013237 [Lithospermum erythrorhizon]